MSQQAPRIVLRLFGPPDLRTVADARAHSVLAQSKHVAFLAIAAAARPSPVRRDRVVGLLWPELDEDRARNALSKAIHNCRRALGEDALVGRFAEDLGLEVDRWAIDLWDFEDAIGSGAHADALALYRRGQFMEGFFVPDASALEHWMDGERARLRRRSIEAATALADSAERSGDTVSAAEHLRILGELSPFDEQVLRRRMQCLDRSADRAGAIVAFTDFSGRLQRELEASPSPETVALLETIRRRATMPTAVEHGSAPAVTNGNAEPPQSTAGHSPSLPVQAPSLAITTPPPSRHRAAWAWRRPVWLVGGALALATVATVAAVITGTEGDTVAPGAIVVTPFVNQTGDSTLTPFGEMVADVLSISLSRNGVADVVDARTRTRRGLSAASPGFIADTARLAALASESGVNTVVTGSYHRTGSSLVVIASIRGLQGRDAPLQFAEEAGPLDDPGEVLRRVEQRLLGVVASLRDPRMSYATTGATSPPDYAAYTEYFAGLRAVVAEDFRAASQSFDRAFQIDTTFVAAVLLLAESLYKSGQSARADSIIGRLRERRVTLPPYDQAMLDFTGAFYSGKAGGREVMYQAARRMDSLAPRSPDANFYLGFAAVTTNRYAEAVAAFSKAEQKYAWWSESTFMSTNWPAMALHMLGLYREELQLARESSISHPNGLGCDYELDAMAPSASFDALTQVMSACRHKGTLLDSTLMALIRLSVADELRAHDRAADAVRFVEPAVVWYREQLHRDTASENAKDKLGIGLLQSGRWAEALALFEPMARARPNNQPPRFAGNAGIAAAHLGNTALAEEMLARLGRGRAQPNVHLQRARILAHLGRKDEAVEELRQMIDQGRAPAEVFHANFGLDPLRGFPAYDAFFHPRE